MADAGYTSVATLRTAPIQVILFVIESSTFPPWWQGICRMALALLCRPSTQALRVSLSTRTEINVSFGKQNRMRCKAATAPQCEHCKREPTQQRAGYGSQKHIYLWAST
jgi:hypothetical protein